MVKSNVVTITVTPAVETVSITVSPTSVSAAGGTVTVSGTANAPDGTVMFIFLSAGVSFTGTVSGGKFSIPVAIPANTFEEANTWTIQAIDQTTSASSNILYITQGGAVAGITISASTTSLPAAGGTVTVTGTSNYLGGVTMYLFYNGTNQGSTSTNASGGFSFSVTVPANNTINPVTDTVYVSDNTAGT